MAKIKSFAERIADALVEDGLLSTSQIEELLDRQKKEGSRLVNCWLTRTSNTSARTTSQSAWAAY